MKIWIVEYGYDGIGDAEVFSAAFRTQPKADAYAKAAAEEQLADQRDGDEDADYKIKVKILKNGFTQRILYRNGHECDWWVVRPVQLG